MQPYLDSLKDYKKVIGSTKTFLDRKSAEECTLGDVVTDAFRKSPWSNIDMSFANAGGLRSVIAKGNITLEDIYSVLPFNNTIDRLTMTGKALKQVFQDKLDQDKTFLQVSGAYIEYTKDYETGNWFVGYIRLPCYNNTKLCYIDDDKVYFITVTSYLATGGDGWTFNKHYTKRDIGGSAVDSFRSFIEKHSPLNQSIEGRIRVTEETEPHQNGPRTIFALCAINLLMALLFCIGSKYFFKRAEPSRVEVPYQSFY